MLECKNTVTVIHHDKSTDDDLYSCTVYHNASWFKRNTIAISEKGARPSNSYECRIMGKNDVVVALGDIVALGVVENYESKSDLDGIDYFSVSAIGDNRRGYLPHWRVSGQ